VVKQIRNIHKWPYEKVSEAFVWNTGSAIGLSQFKQICQFLGITGPYSFRGIATVLCKA